MSYGVQDILSYQPLTEAVETVKTGIPKVLPEQLWTITEDVSGNKARLIEYTGTRRVAKVIPYGAPPKAGDKLPLNDKGVILLHSKDEREFTTELLMIFREWNEYKPQQKFAMREVARQGEAMRQQQENLEIASVLQFVATGYNYFDADGNLLPTSSGAALTVDQGVPASNRNQVNPGGGAIISASWGTASTNIPLQVNNLKKRAIQLTGYPLKYAFYGANIPGYLANNDYTKLMWSYNQSYNDFYLSTGQIKPGFLDLVWVPASQAFFEDSSGVVQEIFPADGITFGPELNATTYTYYKGSQLVPTQFGPMADVEAALKSMAEVFGRGRYAFIPQDRPWTILDVAFNTFLARMKQPNAWFMVDVTP